MFTGVDPSFIPCDDRLKEKLRVRGLTQSVEVLLAHFLPGVHLFVSQLCGDKFWCTPSQLELLLHNPCHHTHFQISSGTNLMETQLPFFGQEIGDHLNVLRNNLGAGPTRSFVVLCLCLTSQKSLVPQSHLSLAHGLILPNSLQPMPTLDWGKTTFD